MKQEKVLICCPFFLKKDWPKLLLRENGHHSLSFFGENGRHLILDVFWKFFNFGSKNVHIEYCALHIGGWSNKGYNSVAVFGKRSDQSSCTEKMATICWLLLVKICCHLTINLFFSQIWRNFELILRIFASWHLFRIANSQLFFRKNVAKIWMMATYQGCLNLLTLIYIS